MAAAVMPLSLSLLLLQVSLKSECVMGCCHCCCCLSHRDSCFRQHRCAQIPQRHQPRQPNALRRRRRTRKKSVRVAEGSLSHDDVAWNQFVWLLCSLLFIIIIILSFFSCFSSTLFLSTACLALASSLRRTRLNGSNERLLLLVLLLHTKDNKQKRRRKTSWDTRKIWWCAELMRMMKERHKYVIALWMKEHYNENGHDAVETKRQPFVRRFAPLYSIRQTYAHSMAVAGARYPPEDERVQDSRAHIETDTKTQKKWSKLQDEKVNNM